MFKDKIYTVDDLQNILPFSKRVIQKKLKQGEIKGVYRGKWLVLETNLKEFISPSEIGGNELVTQ